jgi:hypothetical protein
MHTQALKHNNKQQQIVSIMTTGKSMLYRNFIGTEAKENVEMSIYACLCTELSPS